MNYKMHYDNLINRTKTRTLTCYKERHHIVPRCMGGSDDEENIVDLTAAEHYVAHQLLLKLYPTNYKLAYACHMMSTKLNKRNNKSYSWVREKMAKANSVILKGMKRAPRNKEWSDKISEALKGKKQSIESNLKRSKSLSGREISKETKSKNSIAARSRTKEHQDKLNKSNTGKKRSEETKEKLRLVSERQPIITCPHCGKSGKPRGMKCWHFDKCKENPNGLQRQVHTS